MKKRGRKKGEMEGREVMLTPRYKGGEAPHGSPPEMSPYSESSSFRDPLLRFDFLVSH